MNNEILLLIDGNMIVARSMSVMKPNMEDPLSVGLSYMFFRTYINIAKKYGNPKVIVAWDTGYEYRMRISQMAVNNGVLTKTYKQDRREKKVVEAQYNPDAERIKKEQRATLCKILGYTKLQQVEYGENEADDVIASYCKKYKDKYDIVIVTADKDYYQLLDDNVKMYHLGKKEEYTKESFFKEYKIQPKQWVDVGALMGDTGDTIMGVKGIGEDTALKMIIEHGDCKNLVEKLKVKGNRTNREELVVNAIPQMEIAYELKKMIDNLDVPEIKDKVVDAYILEKVIDDFKLYTLKSDMDSLAGKSRQNEFVFSKSNVLTTFKCKGCGTEYMSSNDTVHCDNCNVDIVKIVEDVNKDLKPNSEQTEFNFE